VRQAVVIGGGPGGLMAAEVLAAAGLQVDAYEHMPSVGRKLLLAGRGGLNITHSEPTDRLLTRYGPAQDRLGAAIREFNAADLRAWCADLGEDTFVGSSGRVFPRSFRATPLLRAWLARLEAAGVRRHVRHEWIGWGTHQNGAADPTSVRLRCGDTESLVHADVVVLALGGASWPRVGSTGTWADTLRSAGIAVSPFRSANSGVRVGWTRDFADRFAGVPLKGVSVSVDDGSPTRGDVVVTASGFEGGPIYANVAALRTRLEQGAGLLRFDLQPDLSVADVAARLAKRRSKDSLSAILRRVGLSPVAVGLMREVTGNNLPVADRSLADLIKSTHVPVAELMPLERAISTAGGVSFEEVDDWFMLRKLPGTFVVGEMIDWEAPTGGYLLQATFSTAVAAAHGAIRFLDLPGQAGDR
jgi:uncharacterized flavoprotein (TIGR03862 family)